MTTEEIISLAKEKFGKDITREEAENYLSGKTPIPEEVLEQVSGGITCLLNLDERVQIIYRNETKCPICGYKAYAYDGSKRFECENCNMNFAIVEGSNPAQWEIRKTCSYCRSVNTIYITESQLNMFRRMYSCSKCSKRLF